MHKDDKGDLSEAKIMARLLEIGYKVSVPWGKNQRYDLIVDTGDKLLKIQCKTGWIARKCVVFNAHSFNRNVGKRDYKGEIDWFVVYCAETDQVYRVSVDECGTSSISLRLHDAKADQPTIKWAKDYIL